MRDLVDASTCFPLTSSGYRGRPLREPCGSPPSSVLWVRTTARLPFPAASGLPRWQVLLAEGLFASLGTPSFPWDLVPFGSGRTDSPTTGEVGSSPLLGSREVLLR